MREVQGQGLSRGDRKPSRPRQRRRRISKRRQPRVRQRQPHRLCHLRTAGKALQVQSFSGWRTSYDSGQVHRRSGSCDQVQRQMADTLRRQVKVPVLHTGADRESPAEEAP